MSYANTTRNYLSCLFVAAAVGALCTAALRADDPTSAKTDDEAAAQTQILDSPAWRDTMYEFDEWLSVQVIYDKDQAKDLRSQMQAKVKKMSKDELRVFLYDLQEKLQILSSPEANKARTWARDYLTKASDSTAAEFRKKLPDVATMTAKQVKQALEDNQEQRANHLAGQKAFEKLRDEQVAAIREMQRQTAEASLRASSVSSGGNHPGYSGGSLAPRQFNRYPGIGAGSYRWGGFRW